MTKDTLDQINVVVQIVLALIALFALIFAIQQYRLSRKRYLEDSRPYIFIELERVTSGLLDLSIRNTGKSAAKNIKIEFSPNIAIYEHSKKKINTFKFLKNLKFLAADKKLSFFFGSIIGGKSKICREFTVELSYQDVDGHVYSGEQVLDPRDFLELVAINRKDINDVAKSLDEIKKELKSNNSNSEKLIAQLDRGLVSRDSTYSALEFDELCTVLKNLLTEGVEGVYNTYPMQRDAEIIAKIARDKLLIKDKLTEYDRKILNSLNKFESSEYDFKTQEIVDEYLAVVKL